MPEWHIWLINSRKFAFIEKYLGDRVPDVEEILYPMATKEFRNSSGRVVKKRIPMYSGYLFLKHSNDLNVLHEINECPFVGRYIGKCLGHNLKDVISMRDVEKWNVDKKVSVGDRVIVNGGPFKGMRGEVDVVQGSKVSIHLGIFERSVLTELTLEDIDILSKK